MYSITFSLMSAIPYLVQKHMASIPPSSYPVTFSLFASPEKTRDDFGPKHFMSPFKYPYSESARQESIEYALFPPEANSLVDVAIRIREAKERRALEEQEERARAEQEAEAANDAMIKALIAEYTIPPLPQPALLDPRTFDYVPDSVSAPAPKPMLVTHEQDLAAALEREAETKRAAKRMRHAEVSAAVRQEEARLQGEALALDRTKRPRKKPTSYSP